MNSRTVYILLISLLCLVGQTSSAQEITDTFDYSYLRFQKVYDYYNSKSINIVNANIPDLYFEAFAWLGTPYHWGGKSRKGVDCSGFTALVCNKLFGTHLGGAAGDLFKKCDEIIPADLQEGDLVFFNINGRYLFHVGIYLQNGRFVHAAVHGGVIVSSLDEPYYKRWFSKAGRLKPQNE